MLKTSFGLLSFAYPVEPDFSEMDDYLKLLSMGMTKLVLIQNLETYLG